MDNNNIGKLLYEAEARACKAYARVDSSEKANEKLLKRIIRGICNEWNRKRFNRTGV